MHFICSEKNGSSGQAWAELFYEWALELTLPSFLKLLIGLAV